MLSDIQEVSMRLCHCVCVWCVCERWHQCSMDVDLKWIFDARYVNRPNNSNDSKTTQTNKNNQFLWILFVFDRERGLWLRQLMGFLTNFELKYASIFDWRISDNHCCGLLFNHNLLIFLTFQIAKSHWGYALNETNFDHRSNWNPFSQNFHRAHWPTLSNSSNCVSFNVKPSKVEPQTNKFREWQTKNWISIEFSEFLVFTYFLFRRNELTQFELSKSTSNISTRKTVSIDWFGSTDDDELTRNRIISFSKWESLIYSNDGEDKLDLWFRYVCWYEQNAQLDPEGLEKALGRCLYENEAVEHYRQDPRMVKLWMKYVSLRSLFQKPMAFIRSFPFRSI